MASRYLLLTVPVISNSDQDAIEDALGDDGVITGADLYWGVFQADIELHDADISPEPTASTTEGIGYRIVGFTRFMRLRLA